MDLGFFVFDSMRLAQSEYARAVRLRRDCSLEHVARLLTWCVEPTPIDTGRFPYEPHALVELGECGDSDVSGPKVELSREEAEVEHPTVAAKRVVWIRHRGRLHPTDEVRIHREAGWVERLRSRPVARKEVLLRPAYFRPLAQQVGWMDPLLRIPELLSERVMPVPCLPFVLQEDQTGMSRADLEQAGGDDEPGPLYGSGVPSKIGVEPPSSASSLSSTWNKCKMRRDSAQLA